MMKKWIAILSALVMILTAASAALADDGILRPGDRGDEVKALQEKLIELEYLEGEATGIYDEATETAVLRFQEDHYLLRTGLADETTRRLIMEETEHAVKNDPWDVYEVYTEEMADGAAYESYMAPIPAAGMAYSTSALKSGAVNEWDDFNTDEFTHFESNRFLSTLTSPLSTFAADVDTSSYAQFRRRVLSGERVPADSIRIEEMLNYFRYDYRQPEGNDPFGVTIEYADCPWNEKTKLLQIEPADGPETDDSSRTWVEPDEEGKVIFDGLAEDTPYRVFARWTETDYQKASPSSAPSEVYTLKNLLTDASLTGTPKYQETLAVTIEP